MKWKLTSRYRLVLMGGAWLVMGGAAGYADTPPTQYTAQTTLDKLLITGNTLRVDDKVFSNFSYTPTGADMPTPANVAITPEILIVDGIKEWGFSVAGGFQDTNSPGTSDAVLRYNVTVDNPTKELIADAVLLGDPDVIGTGKVQVTETWTPDNGTQKIRVYDIEPGGPTSLKDRIFFDTPVDSLSVTKDILASVPDFPATGNAASITSIDQLFSQVTPSGSIPEPASLGLLGLGALALVGRRRR